MQELVLALLLGMLLHMALSLIFVVPAYLDLSITLNLIHLQAVFFASSVFTLLWLQRKLKSIAIDHNQPYPHVFKRVLHVILSRIRVYVALYVLQLFATFSLLASEPLSDMMLHTIQAVILGTVFYGALLSWDSIKACIIANKYYKKRLQVPRTDVLP